MLSRTGRLNLLLKELKWLNIDNLANRIILQKTIFILQCMGLNLRYGYNWYIYGPYSPGLTEDAYEIALNKEYYDKEIIGYQFQEDAKKTLKIFIETFGKNKDDESWMELISSLLFLKKHYRKDGQALKDLLIMRKIKFREYERLEEAMTFIKSLEC